MLDLLKNLNVALTRDEIAERCEFSTTTIEKFSREPDFPKNVGKGIKKRYNWPEVLAFLKKKREEGVVVASKRKGKTINCGRGRAK